MRDLRRIFSILILFVAPLGLTVVKRSPARAQAKTYRVFVGTYTTKTESKGIYAFDYDAATGKLTAKGVAVETPNPSWIVVHPNGKFAYAANESGKESMVSAFALDEKNAKLTLLNQLPALGEDPCHLSFDRTGKYLFVANYTSGNVVTFPIGADGKLGTATANIHDKGKLGPNKERQEAPHAHWVQVSPDNRFLLVADLGLDAILSYRFDATKGTLVPNDPPFARLTSGAGPRHATFSSDGNFLYVLSELNSTITGFAYDPALGALKKLNVVTTLITGYQGRNDAAEIVLHPDGRELLASNRGQDSIALFFVDSKGGIYGPSSHFPNGGHEPRHFAIDPTGHFLLGESQTSNTIEVARIDPPIFTFPLTKVSQVDVPSPVCLVFLPVE